MGQDRVAQHSVRQVAEHRGLHRYHQLARFESECGEAENLVAVFGNQRLHDAARLGNRFRTEYFGHRQLRHAILHAVATRFELVLTDSRQFRVGEHAKGNQAIAVGAIAAAQVRVHDVVVIETDVCELWTARAIAHRPDVFRGGFQPLISPDVTALVELNAGFIETDSVAVCLAAGRDEKIGALDSAISARVIHVDSNASAGMSLDAANLGVQQDLDSLIDEQILERGADVRILAAGELWTMFDHDHIRAEPTKRLREFKADVAAAEHNQMPGQAIKLQRLDMRHRRSLGQAGHLRNCCARTEVEKDAVSLDGSRTAIAQLDLHCAGSDKSRNAIDQFRAAGFGVVLVCLVQLSDHRALAALDRRHIDAQGISLEAELHAAPGQGNYLGGPDQVLAWQAGDVRTRATEQPALDDCHSTTAVAGPCGEFAGDSAADNQVVIFLNVSHLIRLPDRMSR